MKYFRKKAIIKYLGDQLTGNFMGFIIGLSASGLVSRFFETRSVKNLWGLASRKTVIDKDTFQSLEWIISIVIGFIVFEIFIKVVREWIVKHFPRLKISLLRWLISNNIHTKIMEKRSFISQKGLTYYSAVHQGVKQAFIRNRS